jgi:hypothetical protein
MKLRAILKSGILFGFAIGLSINWFILSILYRLVLQFDFPEIINTGISVLAGTTVIAGVPFIGYLAVHWSGDEVNSWTQGAVTGGWAGLLVGIIGYLLNGVLASTLAFGYAPLVGYLIEPTSLVGIDLKELLYSIVRQAIPHIYLSIFVYLGFWYIIGSLGGCATYVIRSIVKRGRSRRIVSSKN